MGSEDFVRETKERLRIRAISPEMVRNDGTLRLRESTVPHDKVFAVKNDGLRAENSFLGKTSLL